MAHLIIETLLGPFLDDDVHGIIHFFDIESEKEAYFVQQL